jgi:signal transduction histidine kinase
MNPNPGLRSSTARLALAYGAISALLISALLGAVFLLTRGVLQREIDTLVSAEVESLTDLFQSDGIQGVTDTLDKRTDSWGRLGAVYLLADSALNPLAGNLTAWPKDVRCVPNGRVDFRIVATANDETVSHPVEARCEHLAGQYWLLVGTDTSDREQTLHRFAVATAWGVGLTSLLVLALGWRYSRRTSRRVRSFATTCDSIVRGDLTRRLSVSSSQDEFDALSTTVNAMLDRLERQTDTLRTTLGSIAHDLRTPLYRLRMRLEESLLDSKGPVTLDLVAPAMAELDRVQRTLGTLLEIARAESGTGSSNQQQVDIAHVAREIFELYAPGLQERGINTRLEVADKALVNGQRQLLAQLLANLLENALKYVPAGCNVLVDVHAEHSSTVLIVADTGPGIAAADRERALQPFVRLHDARTDSTGSGLGLSLVAAIARLHGATLKLEDNHPGLRVICRFPG